MRISWNRISDWLSIVFHFGTENWADQLKKPPCIFLLLQFWPIFARIRIFEAQISCALETLAMFVEQGVEVQVTWSQIFCEIVWAIIYAKYHERYIDASL